MTNPSRKKRSQKITGLRKELAEASASGEQYKAGLSCANLGLALFQSGKFKEGTKHFLEGERIAKALDDFDFLVRFLGIMGAAYQMTDQFPRAYEIAREIEVLAENQGDPGVKSDALATQGQVLVESGDEVGALERLNAALEIAESIDDKRRQMNVMGAFGTYCLTIASSERAGAYFEKARELARELGDRKSEIGFHGNLGALLEWQGEYLAAAEIFEEVLAFVREAGDHEAEVQVLRHLTQVQSKLNNDLLIVQWAQQGVKAIEESDGLNFFEFSDFLVPALIRLGRTEEAHLAIIQAIEEARSGKNRDREVDLLLSLGESYLQSNMLEPALKTYLQALDGTERLQRTEDGAHTVGRIGVILAELGRIDEALAYHERAIELAGKHEIPGLAGEQSAMLAMAYYDKGEYDKAKVHCEEVIEVFTRANLPDQAENARQLLAQIESARTG